MPIHILLIEDNPADADLINEMLTEADDVVISSAWIERLDSGLEYLNREPVDLILLDLSLPDSQGLQTFTKVYHRAANTPIVVMSGLADEELAIEAVHAGAQDYLVKGQVNSNSLIRAIHYAVERKRLENEREKLIADLQKALAEIKILKGFIAICASCKRVRDDQGHWQPIEVYIRERSEAEFSHGLCPDCVKRLYPDLYNDIANTDAQIK